MTCFSPMSAYKLVNRKTYDGRSVVVFSSREIGGDAYLKMDIPCGQCIGCRIEKSREWALRCVHEASLYSQNCAITLTFDDLHLDPKGSLVKSDFQKFMKRLRDKYCGVDVVSGSRNPRPIRYFHCGEYGEVDKRPHHHACLFNFDFVDKQFECLSKGGEKLYSSQSLADLWDCGFATVTEFCYESAAYVARYVTKKLTGPRAKEYGERIPSYISMSNRPGIGGRWFEQFEGDAFPKDYLTYRGVKFKVPKYYDRLYERGNKLALERVKYKRMRKEAESGRDRTLVRLAVKRRVLEKRVERLVRS